jgi:hypothetical protein
MKTQIDLPAGNYDLEVVLNDGWNFGRAEIPLTVEPHDGRQLALSSVALCKNLRSAAVASQEAAQANFAPQYVPLVSKDIQFTPAGDATFAKGEPLFAYFEVYEPSLAGNPALSVSVHMTLYDAATSKAVASFAPLDAAPYERAGGSVLRIARRIPLDQLPKGAYRLEVQASDSAGESTSWRKAEFAVK